MSEREGLSQIFGLLHTNCGNIQVAIHRALELSPRDPSEPDRLGVKASALNQLGDYDQALSIARQAVRMKYNLPGPHRSVITALALSGRIEEARQCCRDLLAVEPTFRISDWDARLRWVNLLRIDGHL